MDCPINFLLLEGQVTQSGHRRRVTHRLRGTKEITAERFVDIIGEGLPHAVSSGHARDTGCFEGEIQNFPRRLPSKSASLSLAREQVAIGAIDQSIRLNPAGEGFSSIGVHDNRSSGVLTLSGIAGDVKAGHDFLTVPDLSDFQCKQFTDPQARSDSQDN